VVQQLRALNSEPVVSGLLNPHSGIFPNQLFGNSIRRSLPSEGAKVARNCPLGAKMHNSKEILDEAPTLFDDIGGEPLTGSGFETESPEPDFATTEPVQLERQAPRQE
jgi:hypothetical protein